LPRWRDESLNAMTERIIQLGLNKCPVCGGDDSMAAWQQPAVIPVGSLSSEVDPDANVRFAVLIFCRLCGHMLLFDSEQFSGGDEYVLTAEPRSPM